MTSTDTGAHSNCGSAHSAITCIEDTLAGMKIEEVQLQETVRLAVYTMWDFVKTSQLINDSDALRACLVEDITNKINSCHLSSSEPFDAPLFLIADHIFHLCTKLYEEPLASTDSDSICLAVELLRLAADIALGHYPKKASVFDSIGNALRLRFNHLGEISDIEDAVSAGQQAVILTPDTSPHIRAHFLNNLGLSLRLRFEHMGDVTDIDSAMASHQAAIDLLPEAHAEHPEYFTELGNSLHARFKLFENPLDIADSFAAHRIAAPSASPSSYSHSHYHRLDSLGKCLTERHFQNRGDFHDIDDLVIASQAAADLVPDSHYEKPALLNNLGNSLRLLFESHGEDGHIETAVEMAQAAVALIPNCHIRKPQFLIDLAICLQLKAEFCDNPEDMNAAIMANKAAVDLTPDHRPDKAHILICLGRSLEVRFDNNENSADIAGAVNALQAAANLTDNRHPKKPEYLHSLGTALCRQFQCIGDLTALTSGIEALKISVNLTPKDRHVITGRLFSLGLLYQACFEKSRNSTDFEAALNAFRRSATHELSRPLGQWQAYQRSAQLGWLSTFSNKYQCLFDIYTHTLPLIPQVASLGHELAIRYQDLAGMGNTANAAAAVAIEMGKPELAIEWLEAGRSVVWNQHLQLRTPLHELQSRHPKLANELELLSKALESTEMQDISHLSPEERIELASEKDVDFNSWRRLTRRGWLATECQRTLATIRTQPQFEDFLLPKKFVSLTPRLEVGLVVIINVHQSRCDSLILHGAHIVHVPLPELSYDLAKKMQEGFVLELNRQNVRERGFAKPSATGNNNSHVQLILKRLWLLVVQPILAVADVNFANGCVAQLGGLPHITWCATGPLAFLPLHAAGIYENELPGERPSQAYKRVVSSYATNLSILAQPPAARPSLLLHDNPTSPILLVSQSDAPGLTVIDGVVEEAARIKKHFKEDQLIHLHGAEATVDTVLHHLESSPRVIHFACHGVQDRENPTNCAFVLRDGRLPLFSLMTKSVAGADLAFLSACQTAMGDEKVPEESVHLAAGMLAIGCKAVIGTTWSIADTDAPEVADAFYARLSEDWGGETDDRVRVSSAKALHEAIAQLRDRVGVMNFLRWIPFVYFGL